MASVNSTFLVLSGMGVPEWSARGIRQTLRPIGAATSQRRTVNGVLIDLAETQFQKFQSTITCEDHQPPAVDGVWPGQILTVDCVSELSYETNSAGPSRTIVPGSAREEDEFSFYRPRLTMMVRSFRARTDEYGATVSWTLDLAEV